MNNHEENNVSSRTMRLRLFLLFLVCGLAWIPSQLWSPNLKLLYGIGLCGFFLVIAFWLHRYRETPRYFGGFYAFSVFMVVNILSSPLLLDLLYDILNINLTPEGMALKMFISTIVVIFPILLLMYLANQKYASLFLQKGRLKLGLFIGIFSFIGCWVFVLLSIASGNFPTTIFYAENLSLKRVTPWIPWISIITLLNGIREELWFRGVFLKRYESLLGSKPANVLQAIVFSLYHVGASYTPEIIGLLVITLGLGLIFGYLMQKTDSLLASVLFHAAMDIFPFIGILSTTL